MNNIIIVGGSKGGVGKSTVCISLVDWLLERGRDIFLIDTDTSNPDVGRNYKKLLEERIKPMNLDERDGWLILLNKLEEKNGDVDIVINTAARNNIAIEANGDLLNEMVSMGGRRLVTFWPLNRQRDCLQLLRKYMAVMTESEIYVLRNLYFGRHEQFELYNSSNLKEEIEAKWKSYNFPDLADRVTDYLMTKALAISEALSDMPLGNKMELKRWRSECAKIYDEVFGA